MNIQIFGKQKCFDTKKAERWFKERRIKFQSVDLLKFGLSKGEFSSVRKAVGLEQMTDDQARGVELLKYLAHEADREEMLFEHPELVRTPVVRNGKYATVGYKPEVWETWE